MHGTLSLIFTQPDCSETRHGGVSGVSVLAWDFPWMGYIGYKTLFQLVQRKRRK